MAHKELNSGLNRCDMAHYFRLLGVIKDEADLRLLQKSLFFDVGLLPLKGLSSLRFWEELQ